MKMTRVVLTLILVAALSLSLPGATSLAQEVLTNDSVIQMVKAALPGGVLIVKIEGAAREIDLQSHSPARPQNGGVSDQGLEAMVSGRCRSPSAGVRSTVTTT